MGSMDAFAYLDRQKKAGESTNDTFWRLMSANKAPDPEPTPPFQVVEPPPSEADDEGLEPSDLAIPRQRIVQPTCIIPNATPGTFRCTFTGKEAKSLESIVFLKRSNGRVLFPERDYSGERLCWSTDGYVPAADEIMATTGNHPQAPQCVRREGGGIISMCPFSHWTYGNNKPKPPVCKETIIMLCVNFDYSPFWLIFHGTGLKVIKERLRWFALKKNEAKIAGRSFKMRDICFKIFLKLNENPTTGKYYVPEISQMRGTDATEKDRLNKCFEEFSSHQLGLTLVAEGKNSSL